MASCSKKKNLCSLSLVNFILCCIVIIRVEFQLRSANEERDMSQNDHLQNMEFEKRNRRSLPTVQNYTNMMNRMSKMEKTVKRLLESHTFHKLAPGTHQFILQGPPGMPGRPGTPGPPGNPGPRGKRGRKGRQGKNGPPGIRGPKGRMGKTGGGGPRGSNGPMGPPGSPGAPGARGTPGESISLPRVVLSPQSLTVNEHQTVRLFCGVSGNPKPQVSWIKEENSTNGKSIQMNRTTVEIVINNVIFEDRGRYICTATNMMGTSRDSADIFVRARPRFRTPMFFKSVGYRRLETRLMCDIIGYPQPKITWRRTNQLVVSGARFSVRGNVLTIKNTNKADAGSFLCRGSNSLGTTLDITTLEVKEVVPAKLIIKPPSSVLIKRLNDVVRLTCTADGSPTPTMHWEKNGHQVPHTEVKSVTGLGLVKSELILKHFIPNQSDVYSCVARNTPFTVNRTTTRVEMRSCSDPGVPENGQRLGTRFFPGQSVSFVCNMGYTQVGQDTILCQPDGQWTDNRPSCRRKCIDPGTIKDGFVIGDHHWEGENITIHCREGRYMKGKRKLTCLPNGTWNSELPSCVYTYPKDCKDMRRSGELSSGVYTIDPDGGGSFNVFCDMDTDGRGWTVIQRRRDGSVDFYRGWTQYKYGFGSLTGEFWLGNDKIHRLTTSRSNMLRVDAEDWSGNILYAKYGSFTVDDENNKYRLAVGSYSGTARDSLAYHNGMYFTTKDRDDDRSSGENCAQSYTGAWWYNACHYSNLNGRYLGNKYDCKGIRWQSICLSMKRSMMMIRS